MNRTSISVPLLLLVAAGWTAPLPAMAASAQSGKKPKKERIDIRQRIKHLNNSREDSVRVLEDVIVHGSRNENFNMKTHHIGALSLSRGTIARTPTLFGESDIIKTLQLEPGVAGGIEGFAGLYVHGGNSDENMYTLDNVPLYQVNHVLGLFSAFNTETIQYADFYKSTFPAHLDGKLSSYIDIHTREGSNNGFHGSFKLGVTSGALNIEGPVYKDKTTFSFAIRRSWLDLITVPLCKLVDALNTQSDISTYAGYAFTDLNAKVTHRFSPKSKLSVSAYWGDDYVLISGEQGTDMNSSYYNKAAIDMRWGNLMGAANWEYKYSPQLTGVVTASASRYKSKMLIGTSSAPVINNKRYDESLFRAGTNNYINDYRIKGNWNWKSSDANNMVFGAAITLHDFMPKTSFQHTEYRGDIKDVRDNVTHLTGWEGNAYLEDNLELTDRLRLNGGVHYSFFKIMGAGNRFNQTLSPRIAFTYTPCNETAIKGGYSRTSQFVYQLSESLISLPTDQWVPIAGSQKPLIADKISLGGYWCPNHLFTFSTEAYMKWMQNLLEYRDEFYLVPPSDPWLQRTVAGSGTAKGIDFKLARDYGKITGHISYSLLWADRLFSEKNEGRRFPARFDNRHKINIFAAWRPSKKFELSASWIGMSGNRITLPTQMWMAPDPGSAGNGSMEAEVRTEINNYRLPFYHRLDIAATVSNKRGYWNFSIFNVYCQSNIVTVGKGVKPVEYPNPDFKPSLPVDPYINKPVIVKHEPAFVRYKFLPIIPSISYTWLF